jgi:hypothetical protein
MAILLTNPVGTLPAMGRTKKPETETVRLNKDLIRKLRHLAAHADISLPDYLADMLNPLVDKRFDAMVEDLKKTKKSSG